MKTSKSLVLLHIFLIFSMVGCIPSLQTQSSPTDITTATSGVMLTLSTLEATYTSKTSKDTIPIELSIQSGKFDLLVPYANVSTPGAFAQLSVTDAAGNVVEPKHSITAPNSEEISIKKDGKSIQCIRGLKLEAAATQVVSLGDLQKYYQLEKGDYTITFTIALPVYRDFLKKKHPEVIQLEAEIKRIQKVADAHVSAADKRSAVNDIQEQIEFLEKKDKDIYLPVEVAAR